MVVKYSLVLSQPCDSPSWYVKSHATQLYKGLTKPHYGRLINRNEVCDHQETLEKLEPLPAVVIYIIVSKFFQKHFTSCGFLGEWGEKLPNYTTVSHISWLKAYSVQLPVFYLWHFIGKTTQQLSLAEKNVSQLLACQISCVPLRYTTVHFTTLPSISNAVSNKKI